MKIVSRFGGNTPRFGYFNISFYKFIFKQNGDNFRIVIVLYKMFQVDFMTVYSKDDVRFTFKNGTEIKA